MPRRLPPAGQLIRFLKYLAGLFVLLGAVGWILTAPAPLAEDRMTGLTGDAANGAAVFAAAGCASCHVAEDAEDIEPPILAGGKGFDTPFGTFYAPNISTHPEAGIGSWSDYDIANAVLAGVSPAGTHYYPSFPYGSYQNMTAQDVADLTAYLRSLPAADAPSLPHDLAFPFNIRRGTGVWKLLYTGQGWQMPAETPQLERGRYLVEALGHCAECHTPRTALGGMDRGAWLQGAPNPSGEGRIPGITPGQLGWSALDITEYLSTGFTPEFDTAGGSMVAVIKNTARLSDEDRAAIAAYLLAVPSPE